MNRVFNYSIVAVASSVLSFNAVAQTQPLSQQMAATVMEIWKDSLNLNPEVPKK